MQNHLPLLSYQSLGRIRNLARLALAVILGMASCHCALTPAQMFVTPKH